MESSFSDTSSVLSMLSRSPSPPSSVGPQSAHMSTMPAGRRKHWSTVLGPATPPSSQNSRRHSSAPEEDAPSSSDLSSIADIDADPDAVADDRPRKRRRVSPSMLHRETTRLDLDELSDDDSQADLERLTKALRTKRKIVVVAGAGISTAAGIPDFRSANGLFKSLKSQHNLKGSGKQLFDADVYRDSNSTSSFHQLVRELSSDSKTTKPTRFHHLLASLAQDGRLLRLYTQNVDGIETSLPPLATQVPVPAKGPWPKTIQLHGGLSKMVCTKCGQIDTLAAELFDGPIPPECKACTELDDLREIEGKRSHGVGKLRPRMVLYNEGNPDAEGIGSCVKTDLRRRPDCVIVVGTALKVPGTKRIVREMTASVRDHRDGVSIWINIDPEPAAREFENSWDIIVKGTSDAVAKHAALRQWDDDDLGQSTEVSEVEVNRIKGLTDVKVVIQSPTKVQKFIDSESLPTPTDSPRPQHAVASIDAKAFPPVSKLKLKLGLPASNGTKLSTILGPIKSSTGALSKTAAAKRLPKNAPEEAPKGSKVAARKPPRAKPVKAAATSKGTMLKRKSIANGQLNFSLTKGNPSTAKVEAEPSKEPTKLSKLAPLTTSPTRENIQSWSGMVSSPIRPEWSRCTTPEKEADAESSAIEKKLFT